MAVITTVIGIGALLNRGRKMRGTMEGWHGDEAELDAEYWALREAYEEEHADDWKYSDERFNEGN